MKKLLFTSFLFIFYSMIIKAQSLNEMPYFERYAKANSKVELIEPVVFIGNSITEGWVNTHPDFFTNNNYLGRGIGGQTSPQILLRFRQDVVDLKPSVVVINIGINDIAENTGKYNLKFTLDNIKSMAEIAQANGIKVILSSVLPADIFQWRPDITDAPQKIAVLNAAIMGYALSKGFAYIDYYSPMAQSNGAMKDGYSSDGVHPTSKGYDAMEPIAKKVIDQVLKK